MIGKRAKSMMFSDLQKEFFFDLEMSINIGETKDHRRNQSELGRLKMKLKIVNDFK